MSTPEEIRERRRQKLLQKLDAKYKDTPLNEEENNISTTVPKSDASITQAEYSQDDSRNLAQMPAKPQEEQTKVSVFEEYRKMKMSEQFAEIMLRVRTLLLVVCGIISAFTMVGKPLLGVKIKPLAGLISLEIIFFAITYFWKVTKGTSYFDNKKMDIPFINNLVGNRMLNLVEMAGSSFKYIAFVMEKVEDVSLYIVATLLACETINFYSNIKV